MEMRRSDLSQDAPALTDLVATLLGNVFKTLLKKSLHFDPVGKTKQSRSMVRTYSFARTLLISSTLCCVVLCCVVLCCIVLYCIVSYFTVSCCAVLCCADTRLSYLFDFTLQCIHNISLYFSYLPYCDRFSVFLFSIDSCKFLTSTMISSEDTMLYYY